MDIETGQQYIKDIEFNFIELPKFNKTPNKLDSIIDQWVYFIKNAENLDIVPENVNDEGLKSAYQEADKHNWTQADLEAYDYVFMREQDERGRITKVQKDIARRLISLGTPIEEIVIATALTNEQVEKLYSENKQ